jgi:hypothetical protein
MKCAVFWGVSLCGELEVYQGWIINQLSSQQIIYPITLKMEAVCSSKMLVNFYQITQRHISDDSTLRQIIAMRMLFSLQVFICHRLLRKHFTSPLVCLQCRRIQAYKHNMLFEMCWKFHVRKQMDFFVRHNHNVCYCYFVKMFVSMGFYAKWIRSHSLLVQAMFLNINYFLKICKQRFTYI